MCLGETTPGKGIAAALHHCARDNLLRRVYLMLGETTPGKGIATALHHCARDNLLRRGESAASCLFSPLPTVFSRALFSTPSPLLGETSALDCSQDFLCKIYSAPFCAASWEWAALHRIPKGDGEKGKWGTGGENPKGEGGSASLMRPPSLGLSPQDGGKGAMRNPYGSASGITQSL